MRLLIYLGIVAVIAVLAWFMCIRIAAPAKKADLAKMWDGQVYGLEDDELVRLIGPPFPAFREAAFSKSMGRWTGGRGQQVYDLGPRGATIWISSTSSGNVQSALRWCARRDRYDQRGAVDMDIPPALGLIKLDADIVMRTDRPVTARMKSLESILVQVTRGRLFLERYDTLREVIVLRGRWDFRPLEAGDEAKMVISVYTDELDAVRSPNSQTRVLFTDFPTWVGRVAGREVVDEIEGRRPQIVEWYNHASAKKATTSDTARAILLANLEKQTSLRIVEERRMIPRWFLREPRPTTQATGAK